MAASGARSWDIIFRARVCAGLGAAAGGGARVSAGPRSSPKVALEVAEHSVDVVAAAVLVLDEVGRAVHVIVTQAVGLEAASPGEVELADARALDMRALGARHVRVQVVGAELEEVP